MQRQGVPKAAVECFFTTLQEATHCVRTAYGDSTITYGGPGWIKLMHGISQGNSGGPPIWAVISTSLLDTLRSKGYGFSIASPITNQEISFVGYSFVNDNDIVQSDGGQPRTTTVKLQQAVDTWEGGLKITGGALGPDKSYWYLIMFNCTVGGKWSYAPVSDTPATLYMKDIQNNRKVICHIRPDQARRNARGVDSPKWGYVCSM
jgi:hypothetical protein